MMGCIFQLVFCVIPFVLPFALYMSNRRPMAKFYVAMTRSCKTRKFYVQVVLICLLLFHYIYVNGHVGEPGVLLSTCVCAAMFSFRRVDRWLRCLLDHPRTFVIFALITLVTGFMPHLYTTAATASFLLLAALFYPSARAISEWNGKGNVPVWMQHPEILAETYYDYHHAKLSHDADSGSFDISAQ